MTQKSKAKQSKALLLTLAAILLMAPFVYAADDDSLEEHSPLCPHRIFGDSKLLDQFHHPADWIDMGFDLRIRHVWAKNAVTQDTQAANNEWHYSRNRARWWTKFKLDENVDFNLKLTWEWRHWDQPRNRRSSTDMDEIIFDTFNITVRNLFDAPLTAVIGRQDIILGDGWLVLDGTPADGSRTIYFDAARFTYQLSEETTADVIFIYQFDDENKWLSPINHRKAARHVTNGQDEKGLILYLSNKSFENTTIDGYYIYKEDNKSRSTAAETLQAGVDSEIHTIGVRMAKQLDENWKFRIEAAKQFGRKDKDRLDAMGGTTRLTYAFNDEHKNELFAGYEYLSGDDPGSSVDEGFDPLWGEWPQYARGGDLPAYLWASEGAVGAVYNLHRFSVGHKFSPFEKWSFLTEYSLMFADENSMRNLNAAKYSTGSNFRGQMVTAYWKYKCCKNLSYHFLVDYFVPGSYYDQTNQDGCIFARFNAQFTF